MTPEPDITESVSRPGFLLLSLLTGTIAGLGAVVFRGIIALVHNLSFYGRVSLLYDANQHTAASVWGVFIVLVPVVGSLGVTLLVTRFAPEAKGHGVPEVMDAVYYGRGVIRPVVAVFKALASALSIGTGGSVGREGPIAQIGSAFGSTVGRVIRMTIKQRITLIAAGAGGGIAATFNTPIGGMLFAVELLLDEVSVATLVPVAIATVTATYVGQIFFGVHPSFVIPSFEQPFFHRLNPWLLGPYAALGLITGVASAIYIRSLYAMEDFFEKREKANPYLRHAAGMLAVGCIMYALMVGTGHYYVEGVGYATIQDILTGNVPSALMLSLLFGLKLLATGLTLGSGGSGGIFSPALFLGATIGGAFGLFLQSLMSHTLISVPAFAVAGMGGMVGGSTGAAMTAIVMIFEMTRDYSVIMPLTITVALSYSLRTILSKESIYTLKLVRRGHYLPAALQVNLLHIRAVRDSMQKPAVTIPLSAGPAVFRLLAGKHPGIRWFPVVEDGRVTGILSRDEAFSVMGPEQWGWKSVADVMRSDFVFVREDERLIDAVTRMHRSHAAVAVVIKKLGAPRAASDVLGIVTWETIAQVMEESVDLFSEYRGRGAGGTG